MRRGLEGVVEPSRRSRHRVLAARGALGGGDIEIEPGVLLRGELSGALAHAERIDPLSSSGSAQDQGEGLAPAPVGYRSLLEVPTLS